MVVIIRSLEKIDTGRVTSEYSNKSGDVTGNWIPFIDETLGDIDEVRFYYFRGSIALRNREWKR